jgi:type I restriction enzyme S subunit
MSPAYIRLCNKGGIDTKFAYWYFMALYWMEVFNGLGGGVRQTIGQEELGNLEIPVPPLNEQQIISKFLDRETAKIDELIKKQEKLIELIIEKRISCITNSVTGRLNNKWEFKKTGFDWLDTLPKHWHFRKLSNLSSKIGDGLHGTPEYVESSNIHFINGTNLRNGFIFITESTRCIDSKEAHKYRMELNESTVLMSINGTIGNLALYRGESIILGKSASYINVGDLLHREFLYYYLQSSPLSHFYDLSVTGSTILNLSLETIRNTYIALPPIQEQVEIVNYLNNALAKIDELLSDSYKSIELLKEHRASLISAAVTGKIDVRNAND